MTEKETLQKFILNDSCLDRLAQMTNEPNIFEILAVQKREIRHSNILAWLLNPNENHGLGYDFLRECIKASIQNLIDGDEGEREYKVTDDTGKEIGNNIKEDISIWLLADFYKVEVNREVKTKNSGKSSVDIVFTARGKVNGEKHNFLLVIENKVESKESVNNKVSQTERYFKDFCEEKYKDYDKKMFIFLTPYGDYAIDTHWTILKYENIIDALEIAMADKTVSDKAQIIINDYIKTIKKHIIGDSNIIDLCTEIYDGNKEALDIVIKNKAVKEEENLSEWQEIVKQIYRHHENEIDLINKNKSDVSVLVAKYIRETLKENASKYGIVLPEKFNKKTYIMFSTRKMTELLDGELEESISPWRTTSKYYYEFDNRVESNGQKTKVTFYLVLGGGEFLNYDNLLEKELLISKNFNAKDNIDYKFKRCNITKYKNKKKKSARFTNDEDLEKKVKKYVEEMLDEIPSIEANVEASLCGENE